MIRGRARRLILSARRFEPRVNAAGSGHAFGDGVHYFFAAVDAIARGKIFGVAGLEAFAYGDGAVFADSNSLHRAREVGYRLLADRANYHVDFKLKFAAGDDGDLVAFFAGDGAGFGAGANTFDCGDSASRVFEDPYGLRVPVKTDAIEFRQIVLVAESGHILFAAAINKVNDFGAEALGGGNYVNGSVAGADAGDATADGELREGMNFRRLDEFHGADYALEIFAGDAEIAGFAEADANEDGVEIFLELSESYVGADGGLLAKFDAD